MNLAKKLFFSERRDRPLKTTDFPGRDKGIALPRQRSIAHRLASKPAITGCLRGIVPVLQSVRAPVRVQEHRPANDE